MSKFVSLIFYLAIYFISALILHFAVRFKNKAMRFVFCAVAVFIPCFMLGVRYYVGVDYNTYMILYYRHCNMSFMEYLRADQTSELGFFIFSRIAGYFDKPQILFFLFAVVSYLPVALFCLERKDKSTTFFIAFLFLTSSFTTGMNIMRQTAAVSIAFYALKYIYDKKLFKFLLCVLLATCFHSTSIVIIPLYFLWTKRGNLSLGTLRGVSIVSAYIIFAANITYILPLLGERFDGYASGGAQGRNLSILLSVIWLVIFFIFRKQIVKSEKKDSFLILLYFIGVALSFTGLINVYLKRIASYFTFGDFILMIELRNVIDSKSRPLFFIILLAYSLFMFVLTYYIMGQAGIFPYNWLF